MPPVKKAAAAAPTDANGILENSRLALIHTTESLATATRGFTGAVEDFKQFNGETVARLDQLINVKQQEFEEQESRCDQQLKKRKIDADLHLREYKRDAAIEFLTAQGMDVVDHDTLVNIKAQLENLKNNHQGELDTLRKELISHAKRDLEGAMGTQKLRHEAESAGMKAQIEQFTQQITFLQTSNKEQREETKLQRLLTEKVADSGKQGAIHQQFGGKT